MEIQLHTSHAATIEVAAVRNQTSAYEVSKPKGGLWTSTLTAAGQSAWTAFCKQEGMNAGKYQTVLTVNPAAKVYEIDDEEDLNYLIRTYGYNVEHRRHIDWEAVSATYDGVHMTANGVRASRRVDPWYSWDCESTVFFRWVF